jgi:hypothetical protein
MQALLETVGERLRIDCSLGWASKLIEEGSSGELRELSAADASLHIQVEADRRPFDVRGYERLSRDAWRRDGEVILENACTSGFDVRVSCSFDRAEFTYRWRPPARDRAAGLLLRSRFHLLARAVLLQYPALWWAGTRGRVPLHASACTAGVSTPLIVGPGGVGRSTLVMQQLEDGESAVGDNLCVGDGAVVWGLVEPLRVADAGGRRMPHGRRETPMPARLAALEPDSVVVLARGSSEQPSLRPCERETAARSLVTSTYMAGELRRYWPFAATLAAGTEVGPAQPEVDEVASAFATRVSCFSLELARSPGASLTQLLDSAKAEACV